jgi:hypothetical protein
MSEEEEKKRRLFVALTDLGLDFEEAYIDYIYSQLNSVTGLIETLGTLSPWSLEQITLAAAFLVARQYNEDVLVPNMKSALPNDTTPSLKELLLEAELSKTNKIDAMPTKKVVAPFSLLVNSGISVDRQPDKPLANLPPVCRHFMQGDCRRKDCAFSHNLSQIPCKFHASTGEFRTVCTAGNDCPFLHETKPGSGVDIRSLDNSDSQTYETAAVMSEEDIEFLFSGERVDEIGELDLDNEEAFPSLLGPSYTSVKKQLTNKKNTISSTVSIASKLAFQVLSDAFPSVPSEFLRKCFDEGKGGVIAAARLVVENTGLEPVKSALTGRNLLIQPTYSSSQKLSGSRHGISVGRDESIAHAIASSLFHASTGDDMSALYKMHRREAEAMARERNALFDKAARAFLAGNGASAASLSKEGRRLDEKMKELHANAASSIFSSRNSSKAGGGVFTVNAPKGSVSVSAVDLHGLHSSEAISASENAISVSSGVEWIALLAGAQSHSNRLGSTGSVYENVLDYFKSGKSKYVIDTYGVNSSVIVLHISK